VRRVGRGNSDLEHLASALAVGRRDDGRVHVLPAPPLSRARGSRARHGGRVRRGRGGAGAWKPLSWKKRWVAKARQLRTRWIAAIVLVRTRRWIFSRRNSRLHARTSTTIASAERGAAARGQQRRGCRLRARGGARRRGARGGGAGRGGDLSLDLAIGYCPASHVPRCSTWGGVAV